jgi:hypothetical protein
MERKLSARIGRGVSRACTPLGLDLLGPGAERYGTWEWTLGKTDSLNRFLTISLSQTASPKGPIYVVEVWVGADDDQHYTRIFSGKLEVSQEEFVEGTDDLPARLIDLITRAEQTLNRIVASQLTESYLLPASPAKV